jgi:hypothetical protein
MALPVCGPMDRFASPGIRVEVQKQPKPLSAATRASSAGEEDDDDSSSDSDSDDDDTGGLATGKRVRGGKSIPNATEIAAEHAICAVKKNSICQRLTSLQLSAATAAMAKRSIHVCRMF